MRKGLCWQFRRGWTDFETKQARMPPTRMSCRACNAVPGPIKIVQGMDRAGVGCLARIQACRQRALGANTPRPAPPPPPRRLRRDYQIEAGVPIVLSTEKPRCGLVYGGDEGANPLDYQARSARFACCARWAWAGKAGVAADGSRGSSVVMAWRVYRTAQQAAGHFPGLACV